MDIIIHLLLDGSTIIKSLVSVQIENIFKSHNSNSMSVLLN